MRRERCFAQCPSRMQIVSHAVGSSWRAVQHHQQRGKEACLADMLGRCDQGMHKYFAASPLPISAVLPSPDGNTGGWARCSRYTSCHSPWIECPACAGCHSRRPLCKVEWKKKKKKRKKRKMKTSVNDIVEHWERIAKKREKILNANLT